MASVAFVTAHAGSGQELAWHIEWHIVAQLKLLLDV